MAPLDETDLTILQLLVEDARRSYREIAEAVSLSPPAVSDRVTRLQELGVIRSFTVDLDQSALHEQPPVLIELTPKPADVGTIYEAVGSLDRVRSRSKLLDGRILLDVRIPSREIHGWLAEHFALEAIRSIDVTPIVSNDTTNRFPPAAFSLDCVVCENTVGEDGLVRTIDGDAKPFCCETCEAAYREEYERHVDREAA